MMRNLYKSLTSITAAVFIVVLSQCSFTKTPNHPDQVMVYQASANLGWFGKKTVANITDHRGEQFMIDYRLYMRLFAEHGYNGVIRFYYNNPYDERLYPVSTRFQLSNSYDADTMSKSFDTSYVRTIEADTLYYPKASVLSKSLAVRKQRFGTNYNPSTATPHETSVSKYN